MPTLSIVTPVYNAAQTLPQTAASVLAQTFRDWEWILVDNGSTDDTPRLGQDLARADSRVRVLSLQEKGVSLARNAGVAAARGEYLLFLDADDLLAPQAAARALELQRQHPDCWILWRYSVGAKDREFWGAEWDAQGVTLYTARDLALLYRKCVFAMPWNKLYRTALAQTISFDPAYSLGEDLLYCLDYLELLRRRGEERICLAHESLIEYVCTLSQDTLSTKYLPDYLSLWQHHFDRLNRCCRQVDVPREELHSLYRQELLVMVRGVEDILQRDPLPRAQRVRKARRALKGPWIKQLCRAMAREKCYSPYYLPVRLGWLWLCRRTLHWQQAGSPWFGKLDWGGYYLLGKGWSRQ